METKISATQTWVYLRSVAGKFRNMGLREDKIYEALKDFVATRCEDQSYPDEKVKELAHEAAAFNPDDQLDEPFVFASGTTPQSIDSQELSVLMEQYIVRWLQNHPRSIKANCQGLCHKYVGGTDAFTTAWAMLLRADVIACVGRTQRGIDKFALVSFTPAAGAQ